MRILFCSQVAASRELGGSKVVVELAAAMTKLGWHCDITSVPEIRQQLSPDGKLTAAQALKIYLQEKAGSYDVVDYDHASLPFARNNFPKSTLMVARSVLLIHHLTEIKFPEPRSLYFRLRAFIHRRRDTRLLDASFRDAAETVREADLVNVPNGRDVEALIRHGVKPERIVVLPYGIDAERRKLFDAVSDVPPARPKVVFVGTFDHRKGCVDFPKIAAAIVQSVPDVTFRLLGTAGLYQTEKEARGFFPSEMQSRLEIIPRYATQDLPRLLSDCSVGIFPSYLEGFGFGLIEMLAAGVPVVAYDAPGPSSILPAEKLVPPGHIEAMAQKTIQTLSDAALLQRERTAAKKHSQQFNWPKIAEATSETYLKHLGRETAQESTIRG
jgi:glycosyltransferase involved in cell wall biosynthesis